jgi:ribosome biogenesis ATPase
MLSFLGEMTAWYVGCIRCHPQANLGYEKSEASSRVVNTLLTELDGLESRGTSVYIIAATNRPDMIDPAMCRPGRLDKLLYVDLPSPEERVEILRTLVGAGRTQSKRPKKIIPVEGGINGPVFAGVEELIKTKANGYSGADLASFVREAAVGALRERLKGSHWGAEEPMVAESTETKLELVLTDFERALDKINPSVSAVQRRKYEALRSKFAGMPVGTASTVTPDVSSTS